MQNSNQPCYAVIFTSKHSNRTQGYEEMASQMEELAKTQLGFIDIISARNDVGITVSYWESLEAIQLWKMNTDHLLAQDLGKSKWYDWYDVKICKVEREYRSENLNPYH